MSKEYLKETIQIESHVLINSMIQFASAASIKNEIVNKICSWDFIIFDDLLVMENEFIGLLIFLFSIRMQILL